VTRRKRVLLVAGGLLAAVSFYEGLTSIVAYTNDAYVRSDLVAVAPQVTGQIIAVHVADNQQVLRGDRLISIDPVPFQLVLIERQAEIDRAEAQLAVDRDDLNAAQDAYNGATANANFARETLQRTASLTRTSDATQAQLDQANDALARAETVAAARQADILAPVRCWRYMKQHWQWRGRRWQRRSGNSHGPRSSRRWMARSTI
jgi:membrane fusion protein, multidrug efflux system